MSDLTWFGTGAVFAFFLGLVVALRGLRARAVWPLLAVVALLTVVPWISFMAYFTHLLDVPSYFEWRARPSTDWLPSLVGVTVGMAYGWRERKTLGSVPRQLRAVLPGAIIALALVILAHAKPLLMPLDTARIGNSWDHGVCLQSTQASCGPCSAATALRFLGYRLPNANSLSKHTPARLVHSIGSLSGRSAG